MIGFTYAEFEKLLEYMDEGKMTKTNTTSFKDKVAIAKGSKPDTKNDDGKKKGTEKDKDTGEKTMNKDSIPKDAQLKALAKTLYKAQYKALTMQDEVDKAINAMTKADPNDPEIATATATGAAQVANAQMRVDTIEAQMQAITGDSSRLADMADTLSAEAKNLALKKAMEDFGDIVKDWKAKADKAIKAKEKADAEKDKESDKKEEE